MAGTVFFVISKVLGVVLRPETWLVLALIIGLRRVGQRRRRAARRWIGGALVGVVALSAYPLGDLLMRPLEERYPALPELERVDGIVILGGAVEADLARLHGQPALSDGAERIVESLILARRFPAARVVYSGGSGSLLNQVDKGALAGSALLVAAGLDPARLIVEDRSRNTWENAVFTRETAGPAEGETWVLVTSAFHMPRAMGVFCAAGWRMVAYPVDPRSGRLGWRPRLNLADHASDFRIALKEWVGILAYRLTGRMSQCPPVGG